MSKQRLVIATRRSLLALWQAEFVKARLETLHSDLEVELLPIVTQGDKILDSPLSKIGGKGLFVKELENAIIEERADIAVHSMKDVPMELPESLELSVICSRSDPTDCLVGAQGLTIESLPAGAVVGTSSLRRGCQLKHLRPDIEIKNLRGNIHTRLSKLDDGGYDAIILATVGLMRMGLEERISSVIAKDQILPAVGQGVLGIESRTDDERIKGLIEPLNCTETQIMVTAERAMNRHLKGGCQVPIAGFAELKHGDGGSGSSILAMRGLVASLDGETVYRSNSEAGLGSTVESKISQARSVGIEIAEDLLAQGADKVLKSLAIL